ncbi:MAG: RNA polymerase factor sigma-54 [Acidobacteriota bacterium]
MALEQKLSLRLSQRLVMTPALQQAIKLLQMSTLELREEIATELQENPALEEAGEPDAVPQEAEPPAENTGESEPDSPDSFTEMDLNYMLQNYFDGGSNTARGMREAPEPGTSWEANLSRPENLSAHLLQQLRLATSDPTLEEIGQVIIGNLDTAGYLCARLEDLVAMGDYSSVDVGRALELVQSFDPPGVAARSLPECLLAQLKQRDLGDSTAALIVQHHLDLLQARRYPELAERLGIHLDELKTQLKILRSLDPKPGERFSTHASTTVIPDVHVVKNGNDYQVVLNDDGFPRLRVSRYCRSILKGAGGASREDKDFVRKKLNAAVRLIKSIEERQRTIYKVACSIVKQQRNFLDRGIPFIRPLVLKDVAEDVGVHESTVSRVVNHKYMNTPNGLFEMRFFFHSGLTNLHGQDISSLTIKEKIRHMVDGESAAAPLSDSAIAERLHREADIPIARRTVAKYREEMRIPPSTVRHSSLLEN